MAFTRQQPFSKKTTDLPDVPSPAYTPTQIKEYIETPSDENKSFVDSFLNELEADAGAGNVGAKKADGTSSTVQTALDEKQTKTALSDVTGATLVGAKKGDGTTSTVQVALDEKAEKGADWTGTWQGFSPSQVDQTIRDQVNTNTSQLAEITNYAYVEKFPIQIPESDDTARIQRAIDSLKTTGGVVQFGNKIYNTSSPLKVYSNITLRGVQRIQTQIISQGDIPTIVSEGYFTAGIGNLEIRIEKIGIYPRGVTAKTHYAIEMVNTYNCVVEDCYINALTMTTSDVDGIRFSADSTYLGNGGNHFVNTVKGCQLQNASIVMQSTDSYIIKNEVWANARGFAIHIQKSEQFIIENQVVGSTINGGLWIKDDINGYDIEAIKIIGNYFDGSYSNVQSGIGLNAFNLRQSQILGNSFWKCKMNGLKISTGHSNSITANTFEDCNQNNNSSDDLWIDSGAANTIVGNTFKNTLSNTNKGMPIHLSNSANDANVVSGNTIYFISNYNNATVSNKDITRANTGMNNGTDLSSIRAAFSVAPTVTAGSQTKAVFDSITYDKLTEFSSGRFTVKTTGVYSVSSAIAWGGQSTNNRTLLLIYKNGVEYSRVYDGTCPSGNSSASGSLNIPLNAGDYIEIYYYTATAASIDQTKSYVAIDRIS